MLFSCLAFFAQTLIQPTLYNRVFFAIAFLITTFSMVMSIEKGPLAYFLISLYLVYILSLRGGYISVNSFIPVCVVIICFLMIFYIVFMGSNSPVEAVFNMFSRALTGQIQPGYHYLEFFPAHHGYLFGRSFPNPGGLLPFENYQLTLEIHKWHSPELYKTGIIGSMPAVYWAEMYANFGDIGIIIPPFFIGFLLFLLNSLFIRFESTPISIALLVWMAMHYKNVSGSSLSDYFFDSYLFFTLIVFLVITFAGGHGVIRFKKKLNDPL